MKGKRYGMLFKEKCKIVSCLRGIVCPFHRDLPEKCFCYILHSKYLYQLKKIIKISPAQYVLNNAIHAQRFYVPHIPEEIRFPFYYVFQEFFLIVLFQCLPLFILSIDDLNLIHTSVFPLYPIQGGILRPDPVCFSSFPSCFLLSMVGPNLGYKWAAPSATRHNFNELPIFKHSMAYGFSPASCSRNRANASRSLLTFIKTEGR